MVVRLLFVLLSTLFFVSACCGEQPDSTLSDTISQQFVSVPQIIYPGTVYVWDGLPVLSLLVPGRVVTVFPDSLQNLHQIGVLGAIELATGLIGRSLGSAGQPCYLSFRGSDPRGILFLRDGIPVNDEMTGAFDLSLVTQVSLRRIEIMNGCGSSTYGPNASDAVVNLVTKRFEGALPYSRVLVSGGMNNFKEAQLEFGRSFGKSWNGYCSGTYLKEDGYRAGTGADVKDFNGNLSYTFGEMRAGVSLWRRDGKVGIPEDTSSSGGAMRKESRTLLGETYVEGTSFEAKCYYDDSWREESDSLRGSLGVLKVKRVGGDLKKAMGFGRNRVVLGGSAKRSEADAGESLSIQVLEGGATASVDIELLPLVFLNPSISYWQNEVYGSEVNPKLAISMLYSSSLMFHASVGRGFVAPSILELFSPTAGNKELTPEHAISYTGGFDYSRSFVGLSASGFGLQTSNPIEVDGTTTRIVNGDYRSIVSGVDIGLSAKVPGFFTGLDLRLTTSKRSDTEDELPYVPKVSATGRAGYSGEFRNGDLGIDLSSNVRYVGERYCEDATTIPKHSVLDFCGQMRIVDLRMFYRVENVLDGQYESVPGFPMPGRMITYGLEWRFWD